MKTAINLLPPRYRRERMLRRRGLQWSILLCGVLATVWGARWYKLREYESLSQSLEAVAREGRPAQMMLREIMEMRQQIERLQHHEVVARELDRQRQVLALLGLVGRAAGASDGRLRLMNLQAVDLQATHVAIEHGNSRSGAEEAKPGAITLSGVSLDSPTVAEFHDALLKSGLFSDVKLIKSNERKESGLAMYDYEVRCEL